MNARRWLMVALAAAAVLLIVGRVLAGVYADYLWYDSLGAAPLWRARMGTISALRAGSVIVATAFAFVNLYAVRQSVVSLVFPRRLANLEIGEEVPGRYLMGAAGTLSVILGVLLAIPQTNWTTALLAVWGRTFSETDPYTNTDLGFFVHWLPFESMLWMWAFIVVVVVLAAVVLLYALTPSLKLQRGALYASTYVRRHITVLIGVLLLMLAWSFRLDMYSRLVAGSGADGAFGYVDHRVGIPGDLLLSLATLGAALIVAWCGYVGQLRLAAISVVTVIGLSLVVREVAPLVAEHAGTDADRTIRERPYVAVRAGYSRRAYAVDAIRAIDSTMTYPTLAAALPWISFWDPPALTRAVGTFRASEDETILIHWRASEAGLVSEIVDPPDRAGAGRAPWTVNRVLAATADDRGAPISASGPNARADDEMALDPPLVYPGAPPVALLPDSLNRIAGISLEPFLPRLATAWSLQNLRMLSADLPQPRPTIVSHRDIRERLEMLTPFFVQGRSVSPVLLGDSLYWSVDLYSAADSYPFSRHLVIGGADRSYLHHAAVAVVHATTGEIVVVPDSLLDPIAATWTQHLSSLFGTWSALPAGIRSALPPRIDGLYAQAATFGRYGSSTVANPALHVPVFTGADSVLIADDVPMVLPGARTTALTLPLIDDAERLRGVLIATGGDDRATMWDSLSAPGPRWGVLLDRLRALDSGSTAREGPLTRGRVRVIPLHAGLGFVQPTYHWRAQSAPSLNRLAVLSDDTARSIAPAAASTPLVAQSLPQTGDVKSAAAAQYAAMREALRRGDWVAFGRAFEALGRLLGQPR
jgi:uncharacterized membrane protein (UPF0182 family)